MGKRRVMVWCDPARLPAAASVPVPAAGAGVRALTLGQLMRRARDEKGVARLASDSRAQAANRRALSLELAGDTFGPIGGKVVRISTTHTIRS